MARKLMRREGKQQETESHAGNDFGSVSNVQRVLGNLPFRAHHRIPPSSRTQSSPLLCLRMQVGRNQVNQWLTQATHQDYFWVLV